MKLCEAKRVLFRRQKHLIDRFTKSNKHLSYDKTEYHAINAVLLELKKLEAEVDTLKGAK